MTEITSNNLKSKIKPTWCIGCGNYGIYNALIQALAELKIKKENLLLVYGIGCASNMASFIDSYGINSLHGRAIASAIGAKLANHNLKVIVIAGDGGTYGEGLNHLISAARGNHDINVFIHNNKLYSLTTGQASPTTDKGRQTKSTPSGLIETALNPLAMSITAGATFVGRGYVAKLNHLKELMKNAITHQGFSHLDIMQPCVTFNKLDTYQKFNEIVYKLEDTEYKKDDQTEAWNKAWQTDKLPIGILYHNTNQKAYHQQLSKLEHKSLVDQWNNQVNITTALQELI